MMLRMKERYWKGLTKNKKYNPKEPILPGAALEQERKILNASYGKISDEEFERRRAVIYNANVSALRSPKPVLTMNLKHGDIVVMHGAEMQKYFEVGPLIICLFDSTLIRYLYVAQGRNEPR